MKLFFKKAKKTKEDKIYELIATEFDENYYLSQYDYIETKMTPLTHFIKEGWKEGKNPCNWFSVESYLKNNPDVEKSGVNPFYHYLAYGKKEGRKLNNTVTLSEIRQQDITLKSNKEFEKDFQKSKYYQEAKKILTSDVFNESKWKSWLKSVPESRRSTSINKAHIEFSASVSEEMGGVLVGWLIQYKNAIVWIEYNGKIFFFDSAYRFFRQDVYETFTDRMDKVDPNSGFLLYVNDLAVGETVVIRSLDADGVYTLATNRVSALKRNPVETAKELFSIHSPPYEYWKRFTKVDWPLLEQVILMNKEIIDNMPIETTRYGSEQKDIEASIIIPLYGRIDFIESQVMEFEQDLYIRNNVELIYVIDDPILVEPMKKLCSNLFSLYQIPFTVVWGNVNRGFSGANNLGTSIAKGKYLVFMNSDVFPRYCGWLESMIHILQTDKKVGVVAPRLIFVDGSIQHAGIEFKYRDDLGVWINHHPNMGLDPALDPNQERRILPAVTGACMVLRREDFDAVGGWDEGYLIGDFEDTDLCLKLYEIGKKSIYIPTVELTHLERQSFTLIGDGDFRTKVVILNATRHQNRWNEFITKWANTEQDVNDEK